ncbi:MAG TPA: hypothetical protein GXZ48_01945 [Acholeplasmataceae bacterium]|nr:hypothetical protein [Acholeplasmataceae bacterium]
MELKISCDASVKLKKMNGINTVECTVNDYEINKDTLSGNIKIEGKYIKDNLDEEYDFSELVPFTVVFRDEDFKLNDIRCENFNFNQIVNQGLECHFDIIIDYTKKGIEEETQDIEEDLDLFVESHEDFIKDAEELEEDEKISEKYDEMLQDILSKRSDNFLEEKESEEVLANIDTDFKEVESETVDLRLEESECTSCQKENTSDEQESIVEDTKVLEELDLKSPSKFNLNVSGNLDKKETINPFSGTLKEKYDNYKVYYISKESEVDRICKEENISISDVLEDFNKHKRIIIK